MKQYFNYPMAKKLCHIIHGSGLDTDPRILDDVRHKYILITWEFHLMNDGGYYDGYWFFTIRIPKADPMSFRVKGRKGNTRKYSSWGIKDVVEDQVEYAMRLALRDSGIEVTRVVEKVYPYKQGKPNPDFNPKYAAYAGKHGYHYGKVRYEYEGIPVEEAEYA